MLVAHWDCRPWADADPDENKRQQAVMGANDGASGVGVLLELARIMHEKKPAVGVDFLFVDAEDWGTSDDELSWALDCSGMPHFAGCDRRLALEGHEAGFETGLSGTAGDCGHRDD